jgi:hypothetical protein
VREEVLVLGVNLSVHLGRRRPRGNSTVPRALRVGAVSQLGCVGLGSVLEWAGLAGRSKAGPVAQFGRGPHPAQEGGFI